MPIDHCDCSQQKRKRLKVSAKRPVLSQGLLKLSAAAEKSALWVRTAKAFCCAGLLLCVFLFASNQNSSRAILLLSTASSGRPGDALVCPRLFSVIAFSGALYSQASTFRYRELRQSCTLIKIGSTAWDAINSTQSFSPSRPIGP